MIGRDLRWRSIAAAWILWMLFPADAVRAAQDWEPGKTWVFAVGVLEWQWPGIWPGMAGAKVNRRDAELIQHFRWAGVPDRQIVYLQDRQATRAQIQHALVRQLSQTRPGDLFVFYYAGHGFRNRTTGEVHFANYDATDGDTAWPVKAIVETIDARFRGETTLLISECCFSGGLADEALRRKTRLKHAFLCSAFSHNSSTGNWTFTETLLKGLRGSPEVDLDGNGVVELGELGNCIEWDMAFIEQQKAVCGRTPKFPQRMRLAAAGGQHPPGLGARIEVEWEGRWYRAKVVDVRGGFFKIHYVNFDDSWDEWVEPERRREFRPEQFASGLEVDVRWAQDQKWYPATILRGWYGLYLVHYEGDTDEWDEWVRPDAVRPRR